MVIIAKDDSEVPKHLLVDSSGYLKVHVMAGIFQPHTETKLGSNCSGSDGDANRVLTLANSETSSDELVTLDGIVLSITTDYTVSHKAASSTITFVVKVWDTQKITVRYYT